MLSKRLIICLDVRNRQVTKGVKFAGNIDLGDPVELAAKYYAGGVDELVFYDITASAEKRPLDLEMVAAVARQVFIPFSVGGGISSVADMRAALLAGAEKISVNSLAVQNPDLIRDGAAAFGNQCIVLGMDVKKVAVGGAMPSGYEVVIHGGRTPTGRDALAWARQAERLGAGEICLNSIDADGTRDGYEINLTRLISENVGIPVIASGGGGTCDHLAAVLTAGRADAALIASMVHYGDYTCAGIKADLAQRGIKVRVES
ncbi:MAG: imidazole glycerol phosphate synthase subunit HisF [Planctomycetota bacterium]|nr:imidazole glycerol phosphate synthase subunit HisF [Planctomycetota bacterium]